jgi:hypothetical protein
METVKKRQKASTRREKRQEKSNRRLERRNGKAKSEDKVQEKNPQIYEPDSRHGPTIL